MTSDCVRPRAVHVTSLLWTFVREEDAQDLIEYALLAAFVGVSGWLVLNSLGPTLKVAYDAWINPTSGTPSLWQAAEPWSSGT
jgi:Flp pilus assembly pilin Flp